MKTFENLVDEVQRPGLCHNCGGCVTFCSAINYGALEMDPDNGPRYRDEAKCIECGFCYQVCPETDDLLPETRERLHWSEPMGHVDTLYIARARDEVLRELGTDGGVVTAMLLHLLDNKRIDSAIVSRQTGPFQRRPWVASTRKDVILSAGTAYEESSGTVALGGAYSTYCPSLTSLGGLKERDLNRVAFVGVPDQVLAMRKMETLGIPPSQQIKYYLGLFCARSFTFGDVERKRLEDMAGFAWDELESMNLKRELRFNLKGGRSASLPLDVLDFMTRGACAYCTDYSAEYADISFGGLGAPDGWTVVLTRTPRGRELYRKARETVLEEMELAKMKPLRETALELIRRYSAAKRHNAQANRDEGRGVSAYAFSPAGREHRHPGV
ncbi:Coenzyme F420 hydrogenase/dehydrogenase, beta subunit C-terminal domain [Desulfohalovibrio reitneri]|uniref:Coenzyme F420 hydrogenase/dehydrogenase, beta subunit C-terminal domain n=1 Tax=Desulfohalovibrio reitneri TaxID=1307759 RepID=UPI0009DF9C3C|nr:Coenzyme F420 hydrogenase/dehydrogenase, beta subunit C-terminal domain [Desulfohalovibrio reitneri]